MGEVAPKDPIVLEFPPNIEEEGVMDPKIFVEKDVGVPPKMDPLAGVDEKGVDVL